MYKIFGDAGIDISFIAVLGLGTLFWILSVCLNDVSIVDILWGYLYTIQVLIFFFSHDYHWGNLVVLLIVGLHGLRLGIFISIRNIGKEEDPRYTNWRHQCEKHYWWISFFQVFMLQAVISLVVCSSFGLFMLRTSRDRVNNESDVELVTPNIALLTIGAVISHIGTWIESIADYQLQSFKTNYENKGKRLMSGTYALCQHPNYFGECVFWWGTYFFSCAVKQYWAVWPPIIMTLLIVFVSGIAKQKEMYNKDPDRYGEQYKIYLEKTAKFIPCIW